MKSFSSRLIGIPDHVMLLFRRTVEEHKCMYHYK